MKDTFACGDQHEAHEGDGFSFVQISDSHIGFNKRANPDVTGTFQAAIDKINSLPAVPDLILHTGPQSVTGAIPKVSSRV
jgi:Icc protein